LHDVIDFWRQGRAVAALLATTVLALIAFMLVTERSHGPCYLCGLPGARQAPMQTEAQRPPGPLFAPASVWNAPIPADAPVDPNSAYLVQSLTAEIAREEAAGIGPWIQTTDSSTPLYTVPRDQPTIPVRLPVQSGRFVALQRALLHVPIPANATPAAGSDRHMTIYQPATDRMWDLWEAAKLPDGWHAAWGGAIDHVSRFPGYYTAGAWPGATSQWGATASSFPVIGGTILVRELRRGRIDHALAMDVPDTRAGVFAWPAQRTDGTGGEDTLPEGARLRIDPRVHLGSLGLPPATLVLARAAQRYGIIVRDRTTHATAFYAQDPTPRRYDPYAELFGGESPGALMAAFPWTDLQVMRMSICSTAPCTK
jgi:hypothetical protein